jgi:hypothetical protein
MRGSEVVYQDFACGNVLIPINPAERAAVASALRSVLSMVDGEISLPFFSTVSDCNADYSQNEPSLADHTAYASALRTGSLDTQSDSTNTLPRRPHLNDNQ